MERVSSGRYNKAIEYLFNLTSLGWKLGLNKIKSLLKELGNPHEEYPVIHVAGTNGKGSTSAMIASILQQAGYKTGLFTSPHLIYVGERIKINGIPISKDELVFFIEKLQPLFSKYKCTFFEALTAICFDYFAQKKVDIAVVEVGLGGRLDATNVVEPVLSIITNVNFDHMKQLGNDRKSIAREKAGIIKERSICLTNNKYQGVDQVFKEVAKEKLARIINLRDLMKVSNVSHNDSEMIFDLTLNGSYFPRLRLPLFGMHQIENAALAIAAANILREKIFDLKNDNIYEGLAKVNWPGRMQILHKNPRVICDVAHNPDGAHALTKSIKQFFKFKKLYLLFGVMKDKDYLQMLKFLSSLTDEFIAVTPNYYRALDSKILVKDAEIFFQRVKSFGKVSDGLKFALRKAEKDDLILCTGSHFTIGEVLQFFEES